MNRRGFVFGGGVAGVVFAGVALAKEAANVPGAYVLCERGHEPQTDYIKTPAIAIGVQGEKSSRSLVPCRHCGVLFAKER